MYPLGQPYSSAIATTTFVPFQDCVAHPRQPFFADVDQMSHDSFCRAPMLQESHMKVARSIVERVGGKAALNKFCCLFTQGYHQSMQQVVAALE
jgi:hypothetical protein